MKQARERNKRLVSKVHVTYEYAVGLGNLMFIFIGTYTIDVS